MEHDSEPSSRHLNARPVNHKSSKSTSTKEKQSKRKRMASQEKNRTTLIDDSEMGDSKASDDDTWARDFSDDDEI